MSVPEPIAMPSDLLAGSFRTCVQDAGTQVKMKAMRALQVVSTVRGGRGPPAGSPCVLRACIAGWQSAPASESAMLVSGTRCQHSALHVMDNTLAFAELLYCLRPTTVAWGQASVVWRSI